MGTIRRPFQHYNLHGGWTLVKAEERGVGVPEVSWKASTGKQTGTGNWQPSRDLMLTYMFLMKMTT